MEQLVRQIFNKNLYPVSIDLATQLPPENETDHIEYKWKFENLYDRKLAKRTGQMFTRLRRGNGHCIYNLGVMDDGTPRGIDLDDMTQTLKLLNYMAEQNKANIDKIIPRLTVTDLWTAEVHLSLNDQSTLLSYEGLVSNLFENVDDMVPAVEAPQPMMVDTNVVATTNKFDQNMMEEDKQVVMKDMEKKMKKGEGRMIFILGVKEDSGEALGLAKEELSESLQVLEELSHRIEAEMMLIIPYRTIYHLIIVEVHITRLKFGIGSQISGFLQVDERHNDSCKDRFHE